MNEEAMFILGYLLALLGVSALLMYYGRQPTNAWSSRLFAGHRRAVPEAAPSPGEEADWPHSEAHRFHRVVCAFVSVVAVVLGLVGLVRNHRPAELAALAAVTVVHLALVAVLLRRFRVQAVKGPSL